MNSRDYWAKREAEALKSRITDEKEYDKQIKRIYSNMLDACQKEINAFYGRYAAKEGITIAEAKKRVSKLDIAAYERKAKRYVKEKNFSAKANEEMRLYNATMKINRLEMLKANIGLELISGHEELDKFMGGILRGRTEDELKRQAGILGKTVKNNAQKAHAIVNASFHNAKFSDRIWMYQDLLKAELSKLLQSGLIQGKNPRLLARELKNTFQQSTFNAERLMRTELARVQTEAQKQSFIRNGFAEYEFIVNGGCCDICEGLKGKHFKVDKMMPGENAPPMHPHCRCSTAAYEDSKEYDDWLDYLDKGGTTAEWELTKHNKNDKIQPKKPLLSSEQVISKAKEIAEEIENSPEVYSFDKIFETVQHKMGNDGLPKVVSADNFESLAKGKTILYRGYHADKNNKKTINEMVEEFKRGKLHCGNSGGAAYGRGTYFTPDESIASGEYARNGGKVVTAFFDETARIVDFEELMDEYLKAGVQSANVKKESYQYVIGDLGSYAALKGYDAIALNGYQDQKHYIMLNRTKMIIKE